MAWCMDDIRGVDDKQFVQGFTVEMCEEFRDVDMHEYAVGEAVDCMIMIFIIKLE